MRPERTMKRTFLASLVLGPALLLAALAAPGAAAAAGPITSTACAPGVSPGTVTCDLWAETGTLALPGGSVTVWGFASTAGGAPTLPGPVLVADEGDVVTVNLVNDLLQPTSILFGGQAMVPDTTGAGGGGGTATYTFTAAAPGTYLYEAGLIAGSQYQVAMGLYGALVVRPAGAPGQAYADASTAFDDEALVVLGEIDPALNNSATPWAVDLRAFAPRWFLVNGAPYSGALPAITTTAGGRLLLRYANAGIQHHSIGVLGLHQAFLGVDGNRAPYPRTGVAETLAPGQSADALIAVPATAATSTKFALYDAAMTLNNSSATGIGGMLALIDAAGTSGADTVGPVTGGVTLTGAGPGLYTLTAVTDETTTGGATIAAAEYRVDSTAAAPVAMAASDAAFDGVTEAVTTAIGEIDTSAWTSGTHSIYVRGQDALGNWGAFGVTSVALDKAGPVTSGLALGPNPTAGGVAVALSGTASDAATGNGNVAAAEYFIDAVGADGSGASMALNKTAPTVSITASIPTGVLALLADGPHTVFVHAVDAAGNWGDANAAQVTLTLDRAGPATSGVLAVPNPTNGRIGVNSTNVVVRVTATFDDAASGGSLVAAGEAFIDALGANGTGFPFVASDSVFNATTETGFGDIPLTTIQQLADGPHAVLVHGRDAAGNWGATGALTLTVDRTAPTLTSIAASPNPTNTTTPPYTSDTSFTLTATASDATTSVTGGEWWEGTDPGAGRGVQFTGSSTVVDFVARGWAAGSHTLNARVRDQAGNWSTIATTAITVVLPDNVFADSFGSGSTSTWTSETDASNALTVTAGASLDGTPALGMQTTLGGTALRFVTDATPILDPAYHVRFYFNPNGALLANNNSAAGTTILSGLNAANTAIFQVQARRQNSGAYQVRLAVLRAGGTTATSWFTITNSSHRIGLAWQSASSASAGLVVDGATLQTLTGLNTSANLLDAIRLGPSAGLVSGASGVVLFDAFASSRRTAIEFLP